MLLVHTWPCTPTPWVGEAVLLDKWIVPDLILVRHAAIFLLRARRLPIVPCFECLGCVTLDISDLFKQVCPVQER
jgi:hypothetical protein